VLVSPTRREYLSPPYEREKRKMIKAVSGTANENPPSEEANRLAHPYDREQPNKDSRLMKGLSKEHTLT
jgi:hypothetical protein